MHTRRDLSCPQMLGHGASSEEWTPSRRVPCRLDPKAYNARIAAVATSKRVLIVDDEPRIVTSWSRALRDAGFVVDSAPSIESARARLSQTCFDAVLLDLQLADGHGAGLLPTLRRLKPRPGIAVVSGYLDSGQTVSLYGHCDFTVRKPVDGRALVELVTQLAADRDDPGFGAFCRRYDLSRRECQVVAGASRGQLNKEIAAEIGCTVATVVSYWQRAFKKTGCSSRNEVLALLLDEYRRR